MSSAIPKSRILIADDNAVNVELLEAFLTGLDCEIAIAVDGKDTLDKVASFKPDLILLGCDDAEAEWLRGLQEDQGGCGD